MPPNHLAVYLSDRCNLACDYCYVAVNDGPAHRLDFGQIQGSIDYFLGLEGTDKKITFLGGEPLLNWPLFQRAAAYAREKGGADLVLQTFTNGTLMDRAKLAFLNEKQVYATISLDGRREVNDSHRRFFGDPEKSVFAEVMARLEGMPKETLGVSLVFDSRTIEDLLGNIDFFYRLGFSRITFNPELYEVWPEERLAVLRRVMEGFARYYRMILESGARPFSIPILFSILENGPKNRAGVRWWHDCHNAVLGPDNEFYACDKALSFPIGQAAGQRVGNAGAGIDWDRRRGHYDEAIRAVEARGRGKDEYFCPMGVYFYAKEAGQDPAALVDNFHMVGDAFAGALTGMIEDLGDHPAFQEIYARCRLV